MRYVSWNMGCAPSMAKKYRARHSEAWEYLLSSLKPDVALVQEALSGIEPDVTRGGRLFWSADCGSDSGTAIWVRDSLCAEEVSFRSEGSYVAATRLLVDEKAMLVVSVHVGPPKYRKHLRTLVGVLSEIVAGQPFVVGGDLNAARHIDAVYKGEWFTRFFDEMAKREFYDCHWRRHGKEVQSFWGRQARHAYQCDHFFVDAATDKNVVCCDIIDNALVRELSDHGPIQLDVSADSAK